MIEGRYIVPRDVFVTLCKELAFLSDDMLKAAQALLNENIGASSAIPTHLHNANVRVGSIEGICQAIIEENKPSKPDTTGGGGAPNGSGGIQCHA